MLNQLSMNSSIDLIANSTQLVNSNDMIDVRDFTQSTSEKLSLKRNVTDTYRKIEINNAFTNYLNKTQTNDF